MQTLEDKRCSLLLLISILLNFLPVENIFLALCVILSRIFVLFLGKLFIIMELFMNMSYVDCQLVKKLQFFEINHTEINCSNK